MILAHLVSSFPADTIHHAHNVVSAHLAALPMADPSAAPAAGGGDVLPNPPAKSPGGKAETAVNDLLGYLKWGVLACIVAGAVISVGLIAIGKWLSHERSSRVGVIGLLSSIGAAVVYGAFYGIISAFL